MSELPALLSRRRQGGSWVLACLGALALGAAPASALSPEQLQGLPGVVVVPSAKRSAEAKPGQPAGGDASGIAEFDELKRVLEATQARLQELIEASAPVAGSQEAVGALRQENQRLTAALEAANAKLADLERARDEADARIAELTEALDAAANNAFRVEDQLQAVQREKAELETRLARAGDPSGTETELADLRAQVARLEDELAEANRAREQALARVAELEASRGGAEQALAEVASLKEQLEQATAAAVEAERARLTASGEAEQLREELARTREELAAARSEVDQLAAANAALDEEVASLRADSQAAIDAARRNLVAMEEKIKRLNAALAGAGIAGIAPGGEPVSEVREAPGSTESSSATPAAGAEADGGAADADLALSAAPVTAASPDGDPELAKFQANIDYLNRRALDVAGSNLFAGIEAAGDGVVEISTTPAWDRIPEAGQRSYLNSLLDLWIVAKEGDGPAMVRIVDAEGRVLLEKSGNEQTLPQD